MDEHVSPPALVLGAQPVLTGPHVPGLDEEPDPETRNRYRVA